MSGHRLAIYWDFDNIHISVGKLRGITTTDYKPEEKTVDLTAVIDNLKTLGTVSINRAYGNWQWMGCYKNELLSLSFDLIQLFPPGQNAKNGADIRLAIEAVDDASRYPEISHFVIIGGDSDFIAAAHKLRTLGKTVIGIGTRNATNKYWRLACDSFKFYEDLAPITAKATPSAARPAVKANPTAQPATKKQPTPPPVSKDKQLLQKAVDKLLSESDEDHAQLSKLRPIIVKLDASFTLKTVGHASMSKFVQAHPDIVRMVNRSGVHLLYRAAQKSAQGPANLTKTELLELISRTLQDRGIARLSNASLMSVIQGSLPTDRRLNARTVMGLLPEIPELTVTPAYVELKYPPGGKLIPITTSSRCSVEGITTVLKKNGIHCPPFPARTRILAALIDFAADHDNCYLGPRSEFTGLLCDICNASDPEQPLSKTNINHLLNLLLRSKAFLAKESGDSDPGWRLRDDLRDQHALASHLEMYVLHRGILNGHSCSAEVWAQLLYQNQERTDDVIELKALLIGADYAAQFERHPPLESSP